MNPTVTCSYPEVDGLRILVLGQNPGLNISYRIGITPERVIVHVDSGEGETFRERNFEGHGVADFDATKGATLDAQLTDAEPTPGTDTGALGTVNGVRGTVDCGQQTTGTSTIKVTGNVSIGTLDDAPLVPALVECYPESGEVIVLGIAHSGDHKILLLVSMTHDGVGVEEELQPSGQRRYQSALEDATLTDQGATANGDVVEQNTASPHTLHVVGDAGCGAT